MTNNSLQVREAIDHLMHWFCKEGLDMEDIDSIDFLDEYNQVVLNISDGIWVMYDIDDDKIIFIDQDGDEHSTYYDARFGAAEDLSDFEIKIPALTTYEGSISQVLKSRRKELEQELNLLNNILDD